MDITSFLAQLWGPVLLATGLGIFFSRKQYMRLYRELEKESLAVLLFGMSAIVIGILQIQAHNVWNSLSQVLISILGWGTLIKGLIFAIAPKIVDKGGDWEADSKLIPVVGVVLLVLGVYLSWIGYFA